MSKVRINDLARELEVKSRAILDALTHVGVTEKKTHSSSLEEDEAERVRQHFQRSGKNGAGRGEGETASRSRRSTGREFPSRAMCSRQFSSEKMKLRP